MDQRRTGPQAKSAGSRRFGRGSVRSRYTRRTTTLLQGRKKAKSASLEIREVKPSDTELQSHSRKPHPLRFHTCSGLVGAAVLVVAYSDVQGEALERKVGRDPRCTLLVGMGFSSLTSAKRMPKLRWRRNVKRRATSTRSCRRCAQLVYFFEVEDGPRQEVGEEKLERVKEALEQNPASYVDADRVVRGTRKDEQPQGL